MVDSEIRQLLEGYESGRAEPQNLLLTLLGDYWSGQQPAVPSAALVELMSLFGIGESSSRQAMRRLTKRDLLAQEKSGRTTYYRKPERYRRRSEERRTRALRYGAETPAPWDGLWTIVMFSIPEDMRDRRQRLRERLRLLNFGLLNGAVWFSPQDHSAEAVNLLDELEVEGGYVIRGELFDRDNRDELLDNAFDLSTLRTKYEEFIDRYAKLAGPGALAHVEPTSALILRTNLMNDWLTFRKFDPELPIELLPENWPRANARQFFEAIYNSLGIPAELCFRKIVNSFQPGLGDLATHSTTHNTDLPEAISSS